MTVEGVEEGVPLNWIYYNVAHADGRQVTMVFTLEKEIVRRAAPAAEKLVNGFEFRARSGGKAESASRKSASGASRR